MNRRKAHVILYLWELIKIGDSKGLRPAAFVPFRQRNNTFVKNWQDRGVWAGGSKWGRSNWEDKG